MAKIKVLGKTVEIKDKRASKPGLVATMLETYCNDYPEYIMSQPEIDNALAERIAEELRGEVLALDDIPEPNKKSPPNVFY